MATEARLDLIVRRNDDTWEFPLRIIGPDLTGAALHAQIRLEGDTPGDPLVDLATVANANAEGIRLAGTSLVDGARVNDVRIRLNKSTRQGLPYAGELGDVTALAWGFQINGRTRLEGAVYLPPQVVGSDNAPTNRPTGGVSRAVGAPIAGASVTIAGEDVTELVVDGAYLLAPMVAEADANADRAEAAAGLVDQRLALVPPTDDGLLTIEYSASGRIQRGQYLDGRAYDPARIVELPPTDDGLVPQAVARVGGSYRVLVGQQLTVASTADAALEMVFPSDARLTYSGFAAIAEKSAQRFRGKRTMADDGKGWQWHCPQARLSFFTAAKRVRIDVQFNGSVGDEVIQSDAARSPFRAEVLVNGASAGDILGTIGQVQGGQAASGSFDLPGGTVRVDLIWPYDKAMDLTGVRIGAGGGVAAAQVPTRRFVASGDSITHGFAASRSTTAWAYKVAATCGLELVNMGYGGRVCDPADGTAAGALGGFVGTYLIGYNDCVDAVAHPARSPAFFQNAVQQYVANWFAANPTAGCHLVLITPLWTSQYPASGEGSGYTWGIQRYRDAMTAAYNAVQGQYGGRLHLVDGLGLMTNAANRLADDPHPNDTGAGEVAANLAPVIQALL